MNITTKTKDDISGWTMVVGAIILFLTAAISVCGGNGWFFSILVPGIGLALVFGGLAVAASMAKKGIKYPMAAAVVCAIAAIVVLGIAVWRVIPSSTPTPVTSAFAEVGPGQYVDVVRDVRPVSTALASITEVENALALMPSNQRAAYLRQHWPHLATDVLYYLHADGRIPHNAQVRDVSFVFTSERTTDVTAESGDGRQHLGMIPSGHIIALVSLVGESTPRHYILQCMNGMTAPDNFVRHTQPLGSYTADESFTIGKREGLVGHVDPPTAISLAQRFHLPLYHGRIQERRYEITAAQARRLWPSTNRVQVTVRVHEGDRFNLATLTCNGFRNHC